MFRQASQRFTSAQAIALLALFLALGGVSYAATSVPANSVGSKQLRTAAVTPSKVNARTIALFRGQRGAPGAAGPAGDPGPPGLQGQKGDPGAPGGLAGYQRVSAASNNNSSPFKSETASCPAGKVAVGGGASTTELPIGAVALTSSDVDGFHGWRAVAQEINPTDLSWRLFVDVICADPA